MGRSRRWGAVEKTSAAMGSDVGRDGGGGGDSKRDGGRRLEEGWRASSGASGVASGDGESGIEDARW